MPMRFFPCLFVLLIFFAHQQANCQNRRILTIQSGQPSLLEANAGLDVLISGSNVNLGGQPTASGGVEPYEYSWLPTNNLSDPELANPIYNGSENSAYVVQVTDNRGCTASDSVAVLILGVDEIGQNTNAFIIYPNPAKNLISIQVPSAFVHSTLNIRIIRVDGKIELAQRIDGNTGSITMDVSNLISGEYIVNILANNRNYNRRLNITH